MALPMQRKLMLAGGIAAIVAIFAAMLIWGREGDYRVLYTNLSDKAVRLNETHVGWKGEAKSIKTYTTTGNKNLTEGTVISGQPVLLDAGSVTTVIYNL